MTSVSGHITNFFNDKLAQKLERDFPKAALYADLSYDGVALVCSAIQAGSYAALCSLREPPAVIEKWLFELGIETLLSSCSKAHDIKIKHLLSLSSSGLTRRSKQMQIIDPQVKQNDGSLEFCALIRSSGSTGEPKSALIKKAAFRASARAVNDYFGFGPRSSWALSLPLYHVSGLSIIFRALEAHASIYLARDFKELTVGIAERKFSHLSVVPTQLKMLLESNVDMAYLDAIIIGGDALPKTLKDEALRRKLRLFSSYGMTESAAMIYVKPCASFKQASVLPHAQIKLMPDGELAIRADSLFSGYVKNGQLIPPKLFDGYFLSGDLGTFDSTGQLQLNGRKVNRIISGGEKIQLEEIEKLLRGHPQVRNAVVVAMPDANFGQRPKAYIEWEESPCSTQEMTAFCKEHLASFKCPAEFISLPRDFFPPNTKNLRALLK
jgi:O-succinylbenzoic acid--CoA ligase